MIVLCVQLESLRVPFVSAEELPSKLKDGFDLVIDAMFGFSFHGKRSARLVIDYMDCIRSCGSMITAVHNNFKSGLKFVVSALWLVLRGSTTRYKNIKKVTIT